MKLPRIASYRGLKTFLAIVMGFSEVAKSPRLMAQYVLGPPADAPTSRTQAQPTQTPPVGVGKVVPRKPIDASTRIEVLVPPIVELGIPVELPLHVSGGTLKTVIIEQRQGEGGTGYPQPIPDAYDLSPVVVRNGKQFIRVTPARLGQVQVRIVALFTDGGLTNKRVTLRVMPSREQPAQFWFSGVGRAVTPGTQVSYRSLQNPGGGALTPTVIYPNAKTELTVDNNFVQYSVRSNPKSGVIEFNPQRGSYVPVGLGHALITGSYSGVTTRVCVVVNKADWEWRRRENCSDVGE